MTLRWIFLLLFAASLHATEIIKHTLYEYPDRIDLMLSFDAPYTGKISRTVKNGATILMLNKVTFPEEKLEKKLHSDIINRVNISRLNDKTLITLTAPGEIQVNASKTVDKRGLRIRIHKTAFVKPQAEALHPIPTPNVVPAQEEYSFSTAFLKIMLVLGAMIALLWFLKKWMEKRSRGNWLFGGKEDDSQIKIVMQKPLDMKNRVVLLSYENREYLVLLGENNLLLDRFDDEEAVFEKLLQKKGKTLGEYLEK